MSGQRLRRWGLTLIGLGLTALALWHAVQPVNSARGWAGLYALERDAYDFRLRLTAEAGLDPRVVVVDVDEQSLQAVGQWPWSREVVAQLVTQLFERYRVDTVGMDIVFAEPETHYTLAAVDAAQRAPQADWLDTLRAHSGDAQLTTALRGRSVVLGYFFERSEVASVGALPDALPEFLPDATVQQLSHAPKMLRYTGNLPAFQSATGQAGFFSLSAVTDPDGVVRRVALLNTFNDQLYPALSLATVAQFLQMPISPLLSATRVDGYPSLEGLDLGLAQVPLDADAAVFVPYRQPEGAYRYVSASKVLAGTVEDANDLSGAIVLLGTSAAGLFDVRNTPLQNAFPGVEIHATLLSALLDGDFRQQPAWTRGFNFLLIATLGGLLAFALPRLSIARASGVLGLVVTVLIASNAYFWQQEKWIVPIATVLVLVMSLYLLNAIVGFFAESRSRQIMRRMFGLYVPPEIVDEMSASPDIYSLQSDKREMSVLFSDVRGFTSISERLTPEELSELLNTLLTPITEIIHHHQGAVDKYMGDAVMAFWGAPIPSDTHAADALSAALAMIERLHSLNAEFAEQDLPRMEMGIGISTGAMSVGNMGSEFRMAYTVLGDAVNLGSRLEGLTKQYGVPLIVSEATQLAAPDFMYQELDLVRVKGKKRPERIFVPLSRAPDDGLQAELAAYDQALAAFRGQDWTVADELFTALAARYPRRIYSLYGERIRAYQRTPPPEGWDGVTVMTEK